MPSPPDPAAPRPPAPAARRPAAPRNFAEEEEVNRLLTVANIQLRRGQTAEAEQAVQEILKTRPRDAGALELLADVKDARGDFEGAQAALKSALEFEPGRVTAEAKLARAALRRGEKQRIAQMGVAYAASNASLMRSSDGSDKSRRWAALGSALIPGLGQYVNGETIKGVILAVLYFAILIIISILPDSRGLAHQISLFFVPTFKTHRGMAEPVSGFAWFLVVLLAAVWLYAIFDAASTARKSASTSPDQDGWKV